MISSKNFLPINIFIIILVFAFIINGKLYSQTKIIDSTKNATQKLNKNLNKLDKSKSLKEIEKDEEEKKEWDNAAGRDEFRMKQKIR